MKRQKWLVFGVVAALVGGAGAVLNKLQASQRLGNPGLRMLGKPVFDFKGRTVCTNTVDLPLQVLGCTSEATPVTQDELSWLPEDTTYGRRRYTNQNDGFWVDLSIVLMGTDHTSIHRPEICLKGQGWTTERSELVTIPIPKPTPYELPVMKITASRVFTNSLGRALSYRAFFVYWFVCENRITARHDQRLWWMVTDLLKTGVLPRWAYIACFSICRPDQEEPTFSRMKEFLAASVPQFQVVSGSADAVSPSSALKRHE